jgi:SAM-dependent methyltransferase
VSRVCIVCGSSGHSPLYPAIVRCTSCDFVFAEEDLNEAELFRIYQKNYFFGEEYSDYKTDREVLQKNFELRLKVLLGFVDPTRRRSLFEIGSAYGFFLDLARKHFENVQGIDITEDGVRHCQTELGLNVIHGDLLSTDLGDKAFDVVCLWDTIEHLRTPNLYLARISEHMPSGALLAVTTGDIDSLNARIKKGKWRLIHPPTHLQYFSVATLTKMLEHLGFDVIYHRHCGFYRSFDNVFHNLFVLRGGLPALYAAMQRLGLARRFFYLNLYDIMYVIARKK